MNDRKNGRTTDGKFAPGNSGRPRGARHKVTRAVEALLDGQAEALTRRAIDAALGGDLQALKLCLDRISPPPRERSVQFAAPEITGASDVPKALAVVVGAVAAGDLTPTEGAAMANLLDRFRSAIELVEIESRITALEVRASDGGTSR